MIKTASCTCLLLCLIYAVCAAGAQGQSASGTVMQPVLTYTVDNANQLRPVIGIVGAASVGPALSLGFDVTQATVPAAGNYLLITPAGSNWPVFFQVNSGALTPQYGAFTTTDAESSCDPSANIPLPRQIRSNCSAPAAVDATGTIDHVALSPGGSAAAFGSSDRSRIYIFNNLLQVPASTGQVDISSVGNITALAVSDDGKTVAIGASDGQSGALYLANPGLPPLLVASLPHPVSITFFHNNSNAIVADDVQNAVYFLAGGQTFGIASAGDGVASPVAVATSNDNQRVFVANSQSGSIMTIPLGGPAAATVYCNCTPTGLHPTNTDSVFRLTDYTGTPILLFDANRAVPRIAFVPVNGSQF